MNAAAGAQPYVLNKGPTNLKYLVQFLKADQFFFLIDRHQANVVTMKYRGIEFYIHQTRENRWNWRIPTRVEISVPIAGVVGGDKEATIAKCHSVIDERLGNDMRHSDWFAPKANAREKRPWTTTVMRTTDI